MWNETTLLPLWLATSMIRPVGSMAKLRRVFTPRASCPTALSSPVFESTEKLQKMSEHAAPAIGAMLAEGHKNRKEGYLHVYRPLYILKGMGVDAKVALPDVIKALDDRYGPVARAAAEVLGNLGPAAKGAVPELLRVS